MKKILSLLSLAALTIALLGSCSKINERLDGLDKRINSLENDKIASVEQQISAINQSIADLETIRTNIRTLIDAKTAQGEDITKLKAADQALEGKINDLRDYINTELSKYSTKDWVNATFATLDQYEATCDTIARIDARLDSMDVRLSKSIEDCADSLKAWVNSQLDGYYTAAQMDAKVAEMNSALGAVSSESAAKADSLATELTTLKTAVDTAKANIRSEYKAAVQSAIETSEGKLSQALKDSIAEVNNKISALGTRVTTLEGKVLALEGKVDKLLAMVQSVTIVPVYTDGSVESTKDGVLYLDIIVSPAQAVATLTKDSLKVLVNEVKTKAVDVDTVAVTKFKADAANGTITARADISSNLPVASGKALTIAVNVRNGISDYTTEFYPVNLSSEPNVTVTNENDTTKVTIKADEDFPESSAGNIVVADGFKDSTPTTVDIEVGGKGTVIFDAKATSQIKANAEQAGATRVFFKVENVTETSQIDADVVLEITMKTVDENGTPVFSEDNAGVGAEATIKIKVDDPNVVFVNRVTLVNDKGEPIQGGVVPGSEDFNKEKGILTFKVNHFSKYAIDYVTTAEYKAVTSVSLDKTSVSLAVGDSTKLIATIAPEDATNTKVTWSSSAPTVATVDATGKVTAVAAGTATITATTVDGNKTATCTVTVIPFVDLGVKTATGKPLYWAECNLGASKPEDPGDYYMWGATALMYTAVDYSKTDGAFTFETDNPYGDNYLNEWDASKGFDFNNVPFADGIFKNNVGERNVFTKYTTSAEYAKSGSADGFTTLKSDDDAATAKNASWRMPTIDDFKSLVANCVLVWTSDYNITGNAGYIVYKAKDTDDKGKANMNGTWKKWNGASYGTGSATTETYSVSDIHIFLPAAGDGKGTKLENNVGCYCSSNLNTSRNDYVGAMGFNKSMFNISYNTFRSYGFSIRPVTEE